MTDPITVVRILLAWLLDAQAAPRSHGFGGPSGPAPSAKVECPDCAGLGVEGRWRVPCVRCGGLVEDAGRGRVVHRPGRGWLVVDGYTGDEVGTVETGTVDRRRVVVCDSCGGWGAHGNGRRCRWCGGSGERTAPLLDEDWGVADRDDPAALEVALEAYGSSGSPGLYRAGDFALLERALGELDRPGLLVMWRTYVVGGSRRWGETDESRRVLKAVTMRMVTMIRIERQWRLVLGLPDRPAEIRAPAECRAWWQAQPQTRAA